MSYAVVVLVVAAAAVAADYAGFKTRRNVGAVADMIQLDIGNGMTADCIPDYFVDVSRQTAFFVHHGQPIVGDVTLSAWVYLEALPIGKSPEADQVIVYNGQPNQNGNGLYVHADEGKSSRLGVISGGVGRYPSSYELPVRQWVFVSAVAGPSNEWLIYAQELLVGRVKTPMNMPAGGRVTVAGDGTSALSKFDGRIKLVLVWRTPRKPEQLFSDSKPGNIDVASPDLGFYVPLNEGKGNVIHNVAPTEAKLVSVGHFTWGLAHCVDLDDS